MLTAGQQSVEKSTDYNAKIKYLIQIISDLEIARGIRIDEDRVDFFVKKLIQEENVSMNQLYSAEKWILYGDWTYKGDSSKKLLLSDFYPSLSQLRSIQNDSWRILSMEELRMTVKNAFDEGKRIGQEAAREDFIAADKSQHTQKLSELTAENAKLRIEARESVMVLAKLQTSYFDLQKKYEDKAKSDFISIFGGTA